MMGGIAAAAASFDISALSRGSLLDGLTLSDPLPTGPLATAVLPDIVDVAILNDSRSFKRDIEAQGWATARVGLGYACVDLVDYRLTIDDIRAELIVDNLLSGERARIWGDANFDADERNVGRFWGTTSLALADGLFITCGTAQVADNPNLYRLDRLTITRGSDAIVVTAIGGEADDMTLTGTTEAGRLEEDTADGLVVVESESGAWLSEEGDALDAAYLARTAPGESFGPGGRAWSGREFGRILGRFVDTMIQYRSAQIVANAPDYVTDVRRQDDDHAALIRAEHRRAALATAFMFCNIAPLDA